MSRANFEDEIIISWVELHRDARYLSTEVGKEAKTQSEVTILKSVPGGRVSGDF